jgi:molybdopterin-biosynthesis enzyme MoeA-like protein
MKFSIDIDCTPEEARAFFGLPNVEALNKAVMDQVQARMMEQMRAMAPDEIMKAWMPNGAAWEQFQKMFTFGTKS